MADSRIMNSYVLNKYLLRSVCSELNRHRRRHAQRDQLKGMDYYDLAYPFIERISNEQRRLSLIAEVFSLLELSSFSNEEVAGIEICHPSRRAAMFPSICLYCFATAVRHIITRLLRAG